MIYALHGRKKDSPHDRFAVAYMKDGDEQWLQTEFNESKAESAKKVVNDHEVENGRPAKFYVTRIDG